MIIRKLQSLFLPGKWEIVLTQKNPLDINVFNPAIADIILKPPFWAYWADPFIIKKEDQIFIFFEEYLLNSSKGIIRVIELLTDGTTSLPETILEESFHLSFPNIFLYKGKYYMVPESSDANCIRLYEATRFPYEWEYCGNIIDNINAVDSIFIEHDDLWFLLTSETGGGGCDDRGSISAYFAKEPITLGSWHPLPSNPIVHNCENGRNAGSIIRIKNKILRPSQNSLKSYGKSISLMEIQEISTQNYKEFLYQRVEPTMINITNTHTINEASGFWCYDRIRISFISIISINWYRLLSLVKKLRL